MNKIQEIIESYSMVDRSPIRIAAASIGAGVLASLFAYRQYITKPRKDLIGSKDAIVITGCDSGIGLALAKHYLLDHNFLIICCFLNDNESQSKGYAELSAMAEANHKHKARLMFRKLDVTSQQDVESLGDFIEDMRKSKKIERLAGLINNSGVFAFGALDWTTQDTIDRIIQVNLIGAIRVTKELLPSLIESRGRVLNVSSLTNSVMSPMSVVYGTSKHALAFFSETLNIELENVGVQVINIRVGTLMKVTNIMESWFEQKEKFWSAMSDKQQKFYSKEFFDNTYKSYKDLLECTSEKSIEANNLFHNFDVALMAYNPPTTIDVMSRWVKVFSVLPHNLMLMRMFIRLKFGIKPFDPVAVQRESAARVSSGKSS